MFSVVIKITKFNESPRRAIQSILNNLNYVDQVRIVNPYFTNEKDMYKGWEEDKKKLNVIIEPELKEKELGDIVVEIPPNCDLKSGAFNTIEKRLRHSNDNQNTLALIPQLNLKGFGIMQGYFIVLYLIDWFWNRLYENNKLIQYTDIQARYMMRKGSKKFLPKPKFSQRFWNVETIPKIPVDTAVLEDQNIMQTLYNHQNMRFGLWILTYFLVWFFLTTLFVALPGQFYSIVFWGVGSLLSYLTTQFYIKTNYKLFYVLLFPLYWVTFPFILIYAKNSK